MFYIPEWRNGRRGRLKPDSPVGSSPTLGTIKTHTANSLNEIAGSNPVVRTLSEFGGMVYALHCK